MYRDYEAGSRYSRQHALASVPEYTYTRSNIALVCIAIEATVARYRTVP
jgi:hypothetical protein